MIFKKKSHSFTKVPTSNNTTLPVQISLPHMVTTSAPDGTTSTVVLQSPPPASHMHHQESLHQHLQLQQQQLQQHIQQQWQLMNAAAADNAAAAVDEATGGGNQSPLEAAKANWLTTTNPPKSNTCLTLQFVFIPKQCLTTTPFTASLPIIHNL